MPGIELVVARQTQRLATRLRRPALQMALEDDVERGQKSKRHGFTIGRLWVGLPTNLRFADDVLLFSTSLVQLQKNYVRLQAEYSECGIENPPK